MTIDNEKHILIVDDEPDVHAVLGKLLKGQNYSVESAYGAQEAFEAIEKKRPDLIILDIMMPKVSGMEVCERIKSDPKTRDILVLIISARDSQHDRIDGLVKGADDYVGKPFHIKYLLRKIEHMLSKKTEKKFIEEIGKSLL